MMPPGNSTGAASWTVGKVPCGITTTGRVRAERVLQVVGGIDHGGGCLFIVADILVPEPLRELSDVEVVVEAIWSPASLRGGDQRVKHLVRGHVLQR
jgi:hypothetical protein